MMREFPYKIDYYLKRWQNGSNIEVLKEEGNFNFDRLQTIVLMEGNYNQNCKRLGHNVNWSAENNGFHNHTNVPEQYGNNVIMEPLIMEPLLKSHRIPK